jgi:general stress protein YciG
VIGSYELTTSNPDKDKKSSSFYKGGQHRNGGNIWDLRDFTIEENNENSSLVIDTGKRGGSRVISGRFLGISSTLNKVFQLQPCTGEFIPSAQAFRKNTGPKAQ